MSFFDAIPPTIVTLGSFLFLILEYNKHDVSPQIASTYTTSNKNNPNVRFSTVKRDTIKLGICIIQTSLFSFLLGWKMDENFKKINNKYLSLDDILHVGLLIFCWFYSTIIAVIARKPCLRKWNKTLNAHLTVIFTTAFLCSMWYLRTTFIISINGISSDITKNIEKIVAICNFILSSIATAVAITTPRGPPLYDNGRPVTPISYSSILDFITFATMTQLLKSAYYKDGLSDSDLDQIPFNLRAITAHHNFKVWRSKSLLYRIWKANLHIMIYQLITTVFTALLFFVPVVFLYNFLEYIQKKPLNKASDWGYVCIFGMLISNFLLYLSIGQQWYWSASEFNTSVRGMLNAEIYAKSLRMLNGLCLNDNEENKNDGSNISKSNNLAASVGKITNLMAVDTNRIGQFSMWWTTFIDCPIQLTIALYFLYQLLGIASIFAFITLIIILPINQFVSRHFTKSQNKLMKFRDNRVNLMNEILQGIRMIKLFAWEKKWRNKILDVRESELKELFKAFLCLSMYNLIWMATPVLVTIVMFYVYTKVQGNELTASIAFTSITIFNELRYVLANLPDVFMQGYQAIVSIRRIETFLNSGEIESQFVKTNTLKIGFGNASVAWNKYGEDDELSSNEFVMKDLNIEFPIGKLSIVCGPTGSGKTLLLMSLLGETNLIKGEIFFPQTPEDILKPDPFMSNWILDNCVAFVAQESFLQNASIRSNITFGLPFHKERYKAVIKACDLQRDFEILEDGDLTEVGEKGLTLSGGQKQRCSLARAVYSRAKHIIIDDALSAVDAHTAKHLMLNCITGPLMNERTIILVTHHVGLALAKADYIVSLKDGKVEISGKTEELKSSGASAAILKGANNGIDFEDIIETAAENTELKRSNNTSDEKEIQLVNDSTLGESSENTTINEGISESEQRHPTAHRGGSTDATTLPDFQNDNGDSAKIVNPRKLIKDEGYAVGSVEFKVYLAYILANGRFFFWFMAILLFTTARFSQIMENWWLKIWSNSSKDDNNLNVLPYDPIIGITDKMLSTISQDSHSLDYYFNIYVLITMISILLGVSRLVWLYYGSLRASRILHENLLNRVIRAPLRFFDTTPVGRILNRFGRDFEDIDSTLTRTAGSFFHNVIMMIGTILVITAVTKEFIIASLVFSVAYVFLGRIYAKCSRDMKRLDSVTKSPIYSHFGETIIGISTIRAYGATKRFMEEMLLRIDSNNRPFFMKCTLNRWLSVRFNILGSLLTFIAGVFILWNLDRIDAGLAGLSMSFAMVFSKQIMWSVRNYAEFEMGLNSIERVCEFLEINQEAAAIIEPRPPASWPHNGNIKVENLLIRYSQELEPVLHHISFEIFGQEKVGIVGRTGSGKSTISLSLFRFIEPSDGKIFIDGIDTSTIGIEDLRSRLTIIPQDPILFSGTIRSNLDVFSQYEEYELYDSLRRVHLLPSSENEQSSTTLSDDDNVNVFKDLDTPINEGGKNISQGQRQLLCLARALLKRSKIILMDEATASIDFAMDDKIQKMIRREFVDCTIICIAHRLRTVIDYDRILVLDQGNVIEFDSPYNLISNSNSSFYQMCQNSGEFDILKA
ncbi:17882_t:CDS:10 [Rhizophagus irregularis]|nr:17882_t:CDS:10 [Rhizophagus irregularis]